MLLWQRLKMNVMMFLSLIFIGIREIMLYIGFLILVVAVILFIDKQFLGEIITPFIIDNIKAVLP